MPLFAPVARVPLGPNATEEIPVLVVLKVAASDPVADQEVAASGPVAGLEIAASGPVAGLEVAASGPVADLGVAG